MGVLESPRTRPSEAGARIRVIVDDDVSWMIEMASRRYPSRFDLRAAELWLRGVVLRQPMMFLPIRTESAFCVAMLSANPWLPTELHAVNAMVCAEDHKGWEAVALLRECIAWAKKRNCVDWRINSDTDVNITPFAHRLGAVEEKGSYRVTL